MAEELSVENHSSKFDDLKKDSTEETVVDSVNNSSKKEDCAVNNEYRDITSKESMDSKELSKLRFKSDISSVDAKSDIQSDVHTCYCCKKSFPSTLVLVHHERICPKKIEDSPVVNEVKNATRNELFNCKFSKQTDRRNKSFNEKIPSSAGNSFTTKGANVNIKQNGIFDFKRLLSESLNLIEKKVRSNRETNVNHEEVDKFDSLKEDIKQTSIITDDTRSVECCRGENMKKKTQRFVCEFCSKDFKQSSNFKSHLMIHVNEKKFTCHICGKMFCQSSRLNKHLRVHSGEKPHHCQMCFKSFSHSHQLKGHLRIHSGDKPYSCGLCGRSFCQSGHLKGHLKTHLGKEPYLLEDTKKLLAVGSQVLSDNLFLSDNKKDSERLEEINENTQNSKENLDESDNDSNEQVLKRTLKFPCNGCEKVFSLAGNLKAHQRVHSGQRPYSCDECGKNFIYSHNLKDHQRTHSGEKPYFCEYCYISFSQMGNLQRHKKVHSSDRPFRCESCTRSFIQLRHLEAHRKTHTAEKKFECTRCNKSYKTLNSLKIHKTSHSRKTKCCKICCKIFTSKRKYKNHNCFLEHDKRESSVADEINVSIQGNDDILNFNDNFSIKSQGFDENVAQSVNEKIYQLDDENQIDDFIINEDIINEDIINDDIINDDIINDDIINECINEDGFNVGTLATILGINNEQEIKSEDEFPSTLNSKGKEKNDLNKIDEEGNHKSLTWFEISDGQGIESRGKSDTTLNCIEKLDSKKIKKETSRKKKNRTPKGCYICDICNKNYPYKYTLKLHMRIHSGERSYVCDVCGKAFIYIHNLTDHKRTHSGEKPFECDKCGRKFTQVGQLQRHNRVHTGYKPYACENCGKLFSNLSGFQIHQRIHSGERPYNCEQCGKTFAQIGSFKKHKETHTRTVDKMTTRNRLQQLQKGDKINTEEQRSNVDTVGTLDGDDSQIGTVAEQAKKILVKLSRRKKSNKRFECEVCAKLFSSAGNLKAHLKIHSGIKPFVCEICQKSFTYVHCLEEHKRVHSGVKPFKCNTCFRAFSQIGNLLRHNVIHSSLYPFSCKFCPKTFSALCYFKAHIKIHTGDKSHVCKVCKKGFTHAQSLEVHLRTHSGIKPFDCNKCNYKCTQIGRLNAHMKTHIKNAVK